MAEEENITALVDAFDAAWNAHDEEAIMDWFTEGAVVSMSPSPPGQPDTYHGKEEISGWMRQTLPGFHVETRRHGELGDTVTSEVTIATDSLPIEAADAMVATVFEGRKVRAMRGVATDRGNGVALRAEALRDGVSVSRSVPDDEKGHR